MKRFYRAATVAPADHGYGIALDGKPLRTPGRAPVAVPTQALANAIADEWNAVGDVIDPRAMRLTGIANAAIDLAAPDPAGFAAPLAAYAGTDLLCYRADAPDGLAAEQARLWNPILDWSERRHGIAFTLATGVLPVAQAPDTVAALADALAALDPFRLAALQPLVTIGGSLVVVLALVDRAIDADTGWAAVTLDEDWQARHWGADAEAAAMLANRRADWDMAARFLALLDAS